MNGVSFKNRIFSYLVALSVLLFTLSTTVHHHSVQEKTSDECSFCLAHQQLGNGLTQNTPVHHHLPLEECLKALPLQILSLAEAYSPHLSRAPPKA